MPSRLKIENLSVRLGGRPVLCDINVTLLPGLTAVVGPNGAGKTTLLRAVLQMLPVQSGNVYIEEKEVSVCLNRCGSRERARHLAYVPQELQQRHMRVRDFVMMGRTPYMGLLQSPGKAERKAAEEAMETLEIARLADKHLDAISGGERRLAYLARAAVQRSEWLLLDEPVANLDFGRQHDFLQGLRAYAKESKTGVLLTIHDPLLAERYCDTLLLLQQGKLLAKLNRSDADFETQYTEHLWQMYRKKMIFADTPAGRLLMMQSEGERHDSL